MKSESEVLHATTVAIGGRAVLIQGPSGAGKSDLALRLIDRGAVLVADDRTIVTRSEDRLIATCSVTITGKIEVRGIGIVTMPHEGDVPIALLVSLSTHIERMPDRIARRIAGIRVPVIEIDPREASAPIKVEIALREQEALSA